MSDDENSMDIDKGAPMSQSDDDSDTSSIDDAKHNELTLKAAELEKKIAEDVFTYANHVELIQVYSQLGELEQLRTARTRMQEHFPLTSELWMSWLRDEIKLISSREDKDKVIELFEKAVQDYLSVDIWQEYQQFSIGCLESHGLDWVRDVLERGVNHGGIHASAGVMLWETYREFEKCILASVQASNPDPQSEPLLDQLRRVAFLFKRQLSVPLLDMEQTYAEFQTWLAGLNNENSRVVDVKAVEFGYKLSLAKLAKILTFEETLMCTESNSRLPTYESYLSFEQNSKEGGNNPTRVQCLYERAVADLPLTDSLWTSYINYLTDVIRSEEPVLKVVERAVRNCPWIAKLWLLYLQRAESFAKPLAEVTTILERALSAGLGSSTDCVDIWAAYISYLRRLYDATAASHAADSEEVKSLVEKFRAVMEKCYSHTIGQFGVVIDPQVKLLRLWSHFEASRTRDLEKMRLIWNDTLADYGADKSALWSIYISMEKRFGDAKHVRKLFARALTSPSLDYPESIAAEWLQYESQEGSLETYQAAESKVEEKLKMVMRRREEEEKKEGGGGGKKKKKKEKKTEEIGDGVNKRKISTNGSPPPNKVSRFGDAVTTTVVVRKPKPHTPLSGETSGDHPMELGTSVKKSEEELLKERGVVAQHDPSKDDRTVFLSNMDFALGEDVVRSTLAGAGTIEEVRLVKNFKGLSKGFAYVVFSKQSEARAALAMDRVKIAGRPLFISECNPEKTSRKPGLKFSVGVLEKRKLFVKGLPFSTTEEELRELFVKYGELSDVRLVVKRNGKSKGLAYVEYKDEISASNALLATDNMQIGDKHISVALSQPPERSTGSGGGCLSTDFSRSISLGGGSTSSSATRGKRTQLSFLPRSLQKLPAPSKPSINNNDSPMSESKSVSMKSNDDFRNMLLGKK